MLTLAKMASWRERWETAGKTLGVRFTESGVDSERRKREGVKGVKENRGLHGRGRKRSSREQSGRKLITASATLDRDSMSVFYTSGGGRNRDTRTFPRGTIGVQITSALTFSQITGMAEAFIMRATDGRD